MQRYLDKGAYSADDIRVVEDHVDAVRRRPQMYLGTRGFVPEDWLSNLAHAALLDGAGSLTMERSPAGWWTLWSPQDWLATRDAAHLFQTVVAFPESGPNSIRPEVVITAFAHDVAVFSRGNIVAIRGEADDPLLRKIKETRGLTTLVAFRIT